jgi:hypothetical protein
VESEKMIDTLYPKWNQGYLAVALTMLSKRKTSALGVESKPTVSKTMQILEQGKPYGFSRQKVLS